MSKALALLVLVLIAVGLFASWYVPASSVVAGIIADVKVGKCMTKLQMARAEQLGDPVKVLCERI